MFFKNTYKIFFVITLLSVTLYGNENVKRYKELFNEDLRGDTLIIGNQALLNKDLDSSNYLKIPDNSTIKYAKLYWWGNFHGGSSALKHAYLKDSNQEELIKVNAEETIIYGKEYISSGEVTDLITGEKGEFQLDKVFPKSQSDVYGSWALQVVYENLDSTYKNISLYDGYIATSKNKKINIQFPKDRTIYGALGTVSKNLFKKTKFLKRESLYFENDLLFSGDKKLRITHNNGFQIFAKKNSFIPFFISSTKEKDEPKEYLLNYQQPKTFQTEEVSTETKPQYRPLKKGFYLGVGGGMTKGDFSSTWNINPPLYTTPLAKYTPSIYFNGGYKGENFRIYGELYDTM
ncbi:MAG: hypothetical protein OIF32_08150, partial [Campylobacterales bacterium]|nr:hypothetical protein [Campylobacterales bacterium]